MGGEWNAGHRELINSQTSMCGRVHACASNPSGWYYIVAGLHSQSAGCIDTVDESYL